jgi:hypothetical protein
MEHLIPSILRSRQEVVAVLELRSGGGGAVGSRDYRVLNPCCTVGPDPC